MDLLLEVGCEEIPARFIPPALAELQSRFREGLAGSRLHDDRTEIRTQGTPRRLVLHATGLPESQVDLDEEILGPKVEAAFDADGLPTKACLGFARSRGVELDRLIRVETQKGEAVAVRRRIEGRPTREVLGEVLQTSLGRLTFPRNMRWGAGEHLFARPVHWLLALLDGEVLDMEFAGVRSDRLSRGHRFTHPDSFEVGDADSFFRELAERNVLVDPAERRELVIAEARRLAAEAGGVLVEDEGLEEEVVHLTELPVPLLGHFDEAFLALPRDVLIAAMRNHQRYFSVEQKEDGKLTAAFVAVGNTPVQDPDLVRHGNERVLAARLSDARFFFETDQKTPPADLVPELQGMVFQADLGSYYEKAIRVASLAVNIANQVGLGALESIPRVIEAMFVKTDGLKDPGERFSWQVARAALLAKTDLLTEMVGEFPELQGEMGGEYARLAGEDPFVARAVAEHYRPRFAGDDPPGSDKAAILSVADRLDTLAGCFGVGLRPTGTADPYALRRQCLGVIAIVLQRGWRLSLRSLLGAAVLGVHDKVEAALLRKARHKARKAAARKKKQVVLPKSVEPFEDALVDDLYKFFEGRLRGRLIDSVPQDVVDAVLAAGMDDLTEARLRADALGAFAREPAFEDLAVAFKRVVNIIKDFEGAELDPDLFDLPEERDLYEVYAGIKPAFEEHVEASRFDSAMELLGGELRAPADRFFDEVLVNDPDDPARQANRKALLSGISMLFGRIADFSRMQTRDAD